MRGSSHIQSVQIGVEYQNCRRALDVYFLVAIQSKPIYKFVAYIPYSPLDTVQLSNFDWICPIHIAKCK